MTRKVFKYELGMSTTLELPGGASFLTAKMQGGMPQAWFIVVPEAPKLSRFFTLYGTGHEITNNAACYLATLHDGPFVWHLFEEKINGS